MNTIITIGRQFGSCGREIGELVAKHFGIPCYDKELLAKVAKDSGFAEEMIERHDERPTSSFLYNLVMDTYSFGYNSSHYVDMPISQKVFLAQFDAIKELAKEGPAVFIGRCADSALADRDNVINLFIEADEAFRIKDVMARFDDIKTEKEARDMINKKDKQRQSYYNYYSAKKWGRADSYDMCINTALLGIEGTVKLIIQLVEDFDQLGSVRNGGRDIKEQLQNIKK